MFIRMRQEQMMKDIAGTRSRRALALAKKYLKEAATLQKKGNGPEFYSSLGKGVTSYLADKLNVAEAGVTTDQLRSLLEERTVPQELIDQALDIIQQCDYARFAPSSTSREDMNTLLTQARTIIGQIDRVKMKKMK
jgi:hypothetical protein